MNAAQIRRLERLLEIPTAPFRESLVIAYVQAYCRRYRIPYFPDPIGNIVLGARDARDYKKLLAARSKEPVRAFIAHMDHPGFHVTAATGAKRLTARWYGGSPVKHVRGARVWLAGPDGYLGHGRITRFDVHKLGYAMTDIGIRVDDDCLAGMDPASVYGGLAFRKPVWRGAKRIYTKAADDLVGVFTILETARAYFRSGRRDRSFVGLLTRGEEVGFVGAVGHLELGWLQRAKRRVFAVSLETSRTLPGALIGRGPVVRLGDRRTVFDPAGLSVLSAQAERVLPGRHQKRIMDGGSCEATAATAWGVDAIGISVPLGNYHNQGFEGGPDCRGKNGPAPEIVHLDDVGGMLKLCESLTEKGLPWNDAWSGVRANLRKNLDAMSAHLPSR